MYYNYDVLYINPSNEMNNAAISLGIMFKYETFVSWQNEVGGMKLEFDDDSKKLISATGRRSSSCGRITRL